LWLAHVLGLSAPASDQAARPAFAAAAMRGFALDPADGNWFIVHPVHVQIARNHLLLGQQRHLQLSDADSRILFDAALPCFEDMGNRLIYGDAQTWFMRADDWSDLDTASPDAATGQNLSDWLPAGTNAKACRKLQNEVQMTWFEHPVNAAREARGQAAINAVWPWANASGQGAQPDAAARLATAAAPAWLAALGERRDAGVPGLVNEGRDALLCDDSLTACALAADWSSWLHQMQLIDQHVCAPLLASLAAGSVKQVSLILSHREQLAEFSTTQMAQRKFWRRPTLLRLLP
jgi:hypothetical protein